MRLLTISILFDKDAQPVKFERYLKMNVKTDKSITQFQNTAEITVAGISAADRTRLLSGFSALNKRKRSSTSEQTIKDLFPYAQVTITAAYTTEALTGEATVPAEESIVFKGDVVLADLVNVPPNLEVKITAFTRQVDKTKWGLLSPEGQMTYTQCIQWVAKTLGLTYQINTVHANDIIKNFARDVYTYDSLLMALAKSFDCDVVAYIDDDMLIVKDQKNMIDTNDIPDIDMFVGVPTWFEWGVIFKTFYNPRVKVGGGVNIKSSINQFLNGEYVVGKIVHELSTRDEPFYITVSAYPAAQ